MEFTCNNRNGGWKCVWQNVGHECNKSCSHYEPCRHEGIQNFTVSKHDEPHLYCGKCGWHKYKGIEYTKQDWQKAFLDDDEKEYLDKTKEKD